jgi:hypothetical protein
MVKYIYLVKYIYFTILLNSLTAEAPSYAFKGAEANFRNIYIPKVSFRCRNSLVMSGEAADPKHLFAQRQAVEQARAEQRKVSARA